jgi:hypothetical protein
MQESRRLDLKELLGQCHVPGVSFVLQVAWRHVATTPANSDPGIPVRETLRRRMVFGWTWLGVIVLHTASAPVAAWAQAEPQRRWTVVPLVGFGVTRVDASWNSAGLEAAIGLEYGGSAWRGSGYASIRGVGVGCSHACFDGGPAFGVGVSRSIGAVWIGGGAGIMKQFGTWRPSPHGRISLDAAPFRFEIRIELPQHTGSGVYLPILVGVPFSP